VDYHKNRNVSLHPSRAIACRQLSSLSPDTKTIIFATQDFQAKEMILAILLGNKAPNQVSVSCLKVG
jgi:hypothetical protein